MTAETDMQEFRHLSPFDPLKTLFNLPLALSLYMLVYFPG